MTADAETRAGTDQKNAADVAAAAFWSAPEHFCELAFAGARRDRFQYAIASDHGDGARRRSVELRSSSARRQLREAMMCSRQGKEERQGGGIEPLCVSTPLDLKSSPSTSLTHPDRLGQRAT